MLTLKEYEQLSVAIEVMEAPVKHDGQVLVPREFVLRLLKIFTAEE